jgi:hypothetical protein
MKNIIRLLLLLACANFAQALPTLQLDIPGGVYNPADETIYATSPTFTLRALLDGTLDPNRMYYVSAALSPATNQTPLPTIGTFSFGGVVYNLASLTYGTPPISVPDPGSGNLAPHGQFPTYFAEVGFKFIDVQTLPAYNTATGATSPGILHYYDFAVDVTGLNPDYKLHFDLYNDALKKGDWTVDDFAPFSHDANSNGTHVPEGGSTMALLGLALLGAAMLRRVLPVTPAV